MKAFIKKILYNRILPVTRGPLRGTRLRVNDLIKGTIFIKNYEPDKQSAFNLLLNKNSVFFDVGANVGLHSYYVSKRFPTSSIFSFEPLPTNVSYIKETVSINKFNNIQVIEAAVGAKSGEAFFDVSDNNSKGMISDNKAALRIKLTSLDDFTSERNIYPDVVKIDVEGFESEVLRGAEQLITKKSPVFIVELHNPEQDIQVAGFLTEHHYEIFRLNPEAHHTLDKILLPIKNKRTAWPDPDGVWGNVVAIHQSKIDDFRLNHT